jgi:hypothetical protein
MAGMPEMAGMAGMARLALQAEPVVANIVTVAAEEAAEEEAAALVAAEVAAEVAAAVWPGFAIRAVLVEWVALAER